MSTDTLFNLDKAYDVIVCGAGHAGVPSTTNYHHMFCDNQHKLQKCVV